MKTLYKRFVATCASFAALLLCAAAQAQNPIVVLEIEKRGTITIELMQKECPKTVAHILSLIKKKFYDGILAHRYEVGFVIQLGDPTSKKIKPADAKKMATMSSQDVGMTYQLGMAGSGKNVPLEATLPHTRGTLGLARSQDPDSGDSQFFFNLKNNNSLDYQYCSFGKVLKGMEVVDKIRQGDKIKSFRLQEKKPTPAKK